MPPQYVDYAQELVAASDHSLCFPESSVAVMELSAAAGQLILAMTHLARTQLGVSYGELLGQSLINHSEFTAIGGGPQHKLRDELSGMEA